MGKPDWCPQEVWEQARYYWRKDGCSTPTPNTYARAILDAKREAYEDAARDVSGPAVWLERWAQHVGSCRGGGHCICGLTLARAEINAIRAKAEGLK